MDGQGGGSGGEREGWLEKGKDGWRKGGLEGRGVDRRSVGQMDGKISGWLLCVDQGIERH